MGIVLNLVTVVFHVLITFSHFWCWIIEDVWSFSFCVGWHACRYCLGTVLNTFAYEEEKQMRLQCQSMLAVAKNIFSHLGESQLISYMW